MIDNSKRSINQITTTVDKQWLDLNRKHLFKLSIMTTQILLLFASLLAVVFAGVAGVYIRKYIILAKEVKMNSTRFLTIQQQYQKSIKEKPMVNQ